MRVLALETSATWCSVAVGDGRRWCLRHVEAGQAHSTLALPFVDEVLAEAGWKITDVDAIAFGAGPGSFTGLRIACGLAQGLAWALGCKVVAVGSLHALAATSADARVITAIDARMGEVYFAAWESDGMRWRECVAPMVGRAADLPLPAEGRWTILGNATLFHPGLADRLAPIAGRIDTGAVATARAVGELGIAGLEHGQGVAPDEAAPVYLRERVALTANERAAGMRL